VQVHFTFRWSTSWPEAAKPKLEVSYQSHLPPSILYSGGTRRVRGLRTTPGDTIRRGDTSMMMMMMMIFVLCPKAGSLAFTPPGDEISEVVSRCLPRRQLRVSNLSKVATQWHEVNSNLRPYGCKAQNIPLHLHEESNSLISATAEELKVTIPR